MADYIIRKEIDGFVEFDVHAPTLDTAVSKFKELEAELNPKVDPHLGEQTLFESAVEPDPLEHNGILDALDDPKDIEVNRSAETGRFVTDEYAAENPATTVTEHIER